jgi:hypothetical protein
MRCAKWVSHHDIPVHSLVRQSDNVRGPLGVPSARWIAAAASAGYEIVCSCRSFGNYEPPGVAAAVPHLDLGVVWQVHPDLCENLARLACSAGPENRIFVPIRRQPEHRPWEARAQCADDQIMQASVHEASDASPLQLSRIARAAGTSVSMALWGLNSHDADQAPALAIGTPMPGSICAGPLAEGRTSMSKISVGMYTVEHEFGMSTTPDNLPSIGAEPRIM